MLKFCSKKLTGSCRADNYVPEEGAEMTSLSQVRLLRISMSAEMCCVLNRT